MKQLLRFKTFLLMAVLSLLAGTSAWAETETITFSELDLSNGVQYLEPFKSGDVSVTFAGGQNDGKYYTTGQGIRTYGNGTITIEASDYTITSIALTFAGAGNAPSSTDVWSSNGTGTGTSGVNASWSGNATKVVLTRPSGSGHWRLQSVAVTYETGGGGSTHKDNNLALTGDPVALSFDLYNNATPQVINYTTSSTGEVTIADNNYATFAVDQDNKTITVTPTAVTPSKQTITVSQAADDSYAAGSVTFTLDVIDSTPTVGGWVETALADLTADDVFVIVGANSTSTYAMSNGNGTTSAPSAVKVTVTDDEITSKVTDDIKWTISGNATNGYTFYPAGSTETWLYCTNANNGVRVGDNTNNAFTVTDGYLKHSGTNRYLGIYSSQDWRCYTSINNNISGQTFKFYRYDDGSTPSKANPELAFSSATAEASVGQPFTAPTLSTAAGFNGTVEYTSSDQTVARVMDPEAGTLEIVGGGTTTITATFAGNDDFKAGSASYTLTVTDNRIATTITQENIVLDVADVATLTKLAPVVKDADNNTVAYQYSEFPPEVSFEVVSDENAIIGSIDNNNGDITLNAVNGTATLKAYYNLYGVNSTYQPSECTFTITVESALENLAAFKALDDNETATVRLNNVKVLAVSGSQYIWLRDASGALLVYNSGLSYTAGQVLNGKMTAKKTTYRNQVETTGTIDGSNIVATDGDAAIPVEVDEADAVNYDSDLVKLSGVTVSGGVIAGENALTIYDGRFNLGYSFDETKTYNITGIIGKYNSTNQIYPISVEEVEGPTVPTITLSPATVNVEAAEANGTITVSYENFTAANPGIELFEADGATPATYDWLTASFDDDATIVYTIQENTTTEARTAYFKAYAMNGETKVYSDLVTVAQEGVVVDYATLPFSFDGGRADIEGTNGFTHEGLGSDYASTPKLKFDTTGDALVLKFNERPGKLTFDIKGNSFSGGTFTVQTSEDGVNYTDLRTYTELGATQSETFNTLGENVRYIKWVYTEKSSGNVALGNIALAKYSAPAPSITLDYGYDYTMDAKAGGGELPVTCSNMPADPQLEVLFYESDGTTSATYDWISATINANGNIDGQIQENTGAARTAYFKVHGVDADNNDVYSNLVTFTQEAPVAATPTIVFNPESIDFDANSGYRTIGGDYFQLKDFDSTPSLEILFYESDGATSATYNWLTVGFNNEGKINIAYDENTGAARSAYLKIHAVGTTVYSNLFTISQAAPTTDYVTLPFNWAGGASADLTAIAGVTASGIGSDYGATHDPYLVKFDSDGDYIQFKTNEQPGVVTIGVKMIGGGNTSTITVQGSADGDKFTDIEELTISGKQNDFLTLATTNEFDSSVRYIRLNFTKGSNVGVGPISIALPALVATPTFDPAAGEVQAGTLVTISTTTVNATIRYTTDGSEPTTSNGEEYNNKPIVINSDVTIKAIAVDDNQNVSAVAEATYTIATSSQLSPELTLDPKSLNVTEGAANGTVTVTTAAGYNGTITVMVDDPSVADASYDAGVITVVYGHAGSAVISVTAGADGDYVEQMEQISVNVSAPVQPAQAAVVVWSEDWSSFDLNDSETPAANGDFTYTYTDGNSATKLYDDVLAGGTSPELLINKKGGAFSATIPLYGAYGNMTLTFKTNNKLSEIHAKVDDDTNNNITADPATVNDKNVYTLSFPVAEGANQVVLTFTNSSSNNLRIDDFQLVAPQVAVSISSVGYATMYYGSSNLVVPAGVTASTYWVDGDLLKVSQEYTEGAVLAKAQGYVLSGAPGSYTFTATNDAANEDPKNLLCGSDVAVTTTAPVAGNFLFYLLGVDNGKVGFYWGKAGGAAFTSGAHKAYLAVPTEQAAGARGFSLDGSVVGINTIGVDMPEGNAYDLQGRRVQQLQKNGLYIVDGKKVLAK